MQIDIGIKESDRKEIADGVSRLLADTFALYLATHGFHWNVTGPQFQTLHTMFETQYNELWLALDEIAERIRALGSFAPASYKQLGALASVEVPTDVPSANEMVKRLVQGHEAVAKTARSVFPAAERGADEATCDLLVQRMRVHEKTAWMLRSLIA